MLPRNSNHKCLKSALNRAPTFLHHSFFSAKKSLFLLIFRINLHLRSEFFDMQTLYGTLWARPTWIKRQIRNVRAKTTSKWKKTGFLIIKIANFSLFWFWFQTAIKLILDLPFISAPKSASFSQGLLESMKIRHVRAKTAKTAHFDWIFIKNTRKRLFL